MRASGRLLLVQAAVPVVAVFAGGVIASAIILAIHENPLRVFALMATFNMQASSVASILTSATPLIFAGLATAIGFQVSVFNIGVEGQYYIGAFAASLVAFGLRGFPAAIHLTIIVVAAMLGGLLWVWIPAVLYLLGLVRDRHLGSTVRIRTPLFPSSAQMPHLAPLLNALGAPIPGYSPLNWFLVIALALSVAAWFWLRRSRFGYEVRATALNPLAAEAAGIDVARVQLLMFLLSGALAGVVGLSDLLGRTGYFDIDFPKGLGFLGISVALLARNDPLGVIPAALLFGYLGRGAEGIQAFTTVPREVITILEAVIILAIVVAYELMTRYVRVLRTQEVM